MRVFVQEAVTVIPRPLEEVFDFFSKAENLEKITPPSLSFKILSAGPIEMKKGALIDYRIRLLGIPFFWRTEITEWEPMHRFADKQLKGPYRLWNHEHSFESHPDGTLMRDVVHYGVPGWIFESIVQRLFVGPRVKEIFAFRNESIKALFA